MNEYLNNIIAIRKSKRLTQKQMAEKLNIAHVNYGRVENGFTKLTVDRLYKIAQILDVDINAILFPENDITQTNQKLEEENLRLKRYNTALLDLVNTKNWIINHISLTDPSIDKYFINR